jgi:signal peptidase I
LTDHLGPSSPAREDTRAEPGRSRRTSWFELVLLVALTLAVAGLIRTFLVQPFFIPSESMENTLRVGDRVLVDKVSYRFHDIHRGDVVVFNGLDSFTPEVQVDESSNPVVRGLRSVGAAVGVAPPGEKDFIKRVIGVPGDRVVCCDAKGRVTVNGTALDEAEYVFPGNVPSEATFDVTVPAGRLWVMGDHRSESADSRAHTGGPGGGSVPADKVIGRAFAVVWPIGGMRGLGAPDSFAEIPSPSAAAGPATPYALALGAQPPLAGASATTPRGDGGQGR